MPEGDTLHRLAARITQRLAGQRCVACTTRDPRLVGVDLTGRVLVGAVAVGKHLFVRFDDDRSLHAHLGMDGRFVVGPRATQPEWRRRVELRLDRGWLTGLDVPVVGVLPTAGEAAVVEHLGPDVNDPDFDVVEAARRLVSMPDTPVAAALLDQRLIAGLGNVFAVEVPFVVGVSPLAPVGQVGDAEPMVAVAVALIRDSTHRGVRNTTGRRLDRADHWVYGRGDLPCQVCDTRIVGAAEADTPWRRVSAWCPRCQPSGATVDVSRARRLLALHPARRQPVFPPGS